MIGDPSDDPPWLALATREIGVKEMPGARSHPHILGYHATTHLHAAQDSVPWCAAFVCWCLEAANVTSTRSAAAASYRTWGVPSELRRGAVVVFGKTDPDAAGTGHVAFLVSVGEDVYGDDVYVLGGNQRDAVSVARRPKSRIVAVRWPRVA